MEVGMIFLILQKMFLCGCGLHGLKYSKRRLMARPDGDRFQRVINCWSLVGIVHLTCKRQLEIRHEQYNPQQLFTTDNDSTAKWQQQSFKITKKKKKTQNEQN